jgi:adenine-specific DNA methylase
VFSNGRSNYAFNMDVFDISGEFDLVYIDSPYMTPKNGGIDYRDYYHFLEGMSRYDEWNVLVDMGNPARKLRRQYSIWLDETRIEKAFEYLFDKFRASTLVVSYRTGGIPSAVTLKRLLSKRKGKVMMKKRFYKYALAKTSGWELLFIAC